MPCRACCQIILFPYWEITARKDLCLINRINIVWQRRNLFSHSLNYRGSTEQCILRNNLSESFKMHDRSNIINCIENRNLSHTRMKRPHSVSLSLFFKTHIFCELSILLKDRLLYVGQDVRVTTVPLCRGPNCLHPLWYRGQHQVDLL